MPGPHALRRCRLAPIRNESLFCFLLFLLLFHALCATSPSPGPPHLENVDADSAAQGKPESSHLLSFPVYRRARHPTAGPHADSPLPLCAEPWPDTTAADATSTRRQESEHEPPHEPLQQRQQDMPTASDAPPTVAHLTVVVMVESEQVSVRALQRLLRSLESSQDYLHRLGWRKHCNASEDEEECDPKAADCEQQDSRSSSSHSTPPPPPSTPPPFRVDFASVDVDIVVGTRDIEASTLYDWVLSHFSWNLGRVLVRPMTNVTSSASLWVHAWHPAMAGGTSEKEAGGQAGNKTDKHTEEEASESQCSPSSSQDCQSTTYAKREQGSSRYSPRNQQQPTPPQPCGRVLHPALLLDGRTVVSRPALAHALAAFSFAQTAPGPLRLGSIALQHPLTVMSNTSTSLPIIFDLLMSLEQSSSEESLAPLSPFLSVAPPSFALLVWPEVWSGFADWYEQEAKESILASKVDDPVSPQRHSAGENDADHECSDAGEESTFHVENDFAENADANPMPFHTSHDTNQQGGCNSGSCSLSANGTDDYALKHNSRHPAPHLPHISHRSAHALPWIQPLLVTSPSPNPSPSLIRIPDAESSSDQSPLPHAPWWLWFASYCEQHDLLHLFFPDDEASFAVLSFEDGVARDALPPWLTHQAGLWKMGVAAQTECDPWSESEDSNQDHSDKDALFPRNPEVVGASDGEGMGEDNEREDQVEEDHTLTAALQTAALLRAATSLKQECTLPSCAISVTALPEVEKPGTNTSAPISSTLQSSPWSSILILDWAGQVVVGCNTINCQNVAPNASLPAADIGFCRQTVFGAECAFMSESSSTSTPPSPHFESVNSDTATNASNLNSSVLSGKCVPASSTLLQALEMTTPHLRSYHRGEQQGDAKDNSDTTTGTTAMRSVLDGLIEEKDEIIFFEPTLLAEALPLLTRDTNKTIVLVTCNSGFVDFFDNWFISIQRLHITNFLVVAEDIDAYVTLRARHADHVFLTPGALHQPPPSPTSSASVNNSATNASALPVVIPPSPSLNYSARAFQYASKDYNLLVGRRPRYLQMLLGLGYNVVYSDIDTVWLESPMPYIRGHHDLWIQSDLDHPGSSPWSMLCTGFMALTPSATTLALMHAWHDALVRVVPGKDVNQYIFNEVLQQQFVDPGLLRVRVLDPVKFPSGALYFDERWRLEQDEPPAVVHNNYVVGRERKLARFKRLGLWFL